MVAGGYADGGGEDSYVAGVRVFHLSTRPALGVGVGYAFFVRLVLCCTHGRKFLGSLFCFCFGLLQAPVLPVIGMHQYPP